MPLDPLRDEKGLAFILGSISVTVHSPLYAHEELVVRTWCKEARGYIFNRYFEIIRNGEIIAEASSIWVLIDIKTKNMVRADNYPFLKEYFYYDEPIDSSRLLPKARIGRDAELYEVGKRKIVYSDIDYNMHMNNTRYPDMICDFLSEMTDESIGFRVASASLSYLKESHLGATLTVFRSVMSDDGSVLIRTVNENGDICLEAVIKLAKS